MSNSSSNNSKRLRSSPGEAVPPSKKSPLTEQPAMENTSSPQLATMIKEVMTGLLDMKLAPLATKADIDSLRDEVKSLREENLQLKSELFSLKELYRKEESRIEELEIVSKRNNLVFKGVKRSKEDDLDMKITEFCGDLLKVDVKSNNLHTIPLGPRDKPNVPLLVTFTHPKDRIAILKSARVLRGTGFTVHQDLPVETRNKRSKLLQIRREILRINSGVKVTVLTNYMLVEGHRFSWSNQEGLLQAGDKGVPKLNSLLNINLTDFIDRLRTGSLPTNTHTAQGPQPEGETMVLSSSRSS